jgi:transposase
VGYNVQIAVEAEHHLIVTHEVTNEGSDRSQLSHVAKETKATLDVDKLDVVADRGYFNGEEILELRGSWHHGHAAKADDLELKGGWALR